MIKKSQIGLISVINEQKEIGSNGPFNATLVDISVTDKGNKPVVDAKVKFFYKGERILYDKTYRTDSNGVIANIPVLVNEEYITMTLPGDKNKTKTDFWENGKKFACKKNTEIEIEIKTEGEKYKNKYTICLNNGYLKEF